MGSKTSVAVRAEVLNQTVISHRVPVGTSFPASRDLRPIRSTQLHSSLYKLHSLCWLCSRAVEVLIVFVICRISIRVHITRDASRCPSDRLQ
jgi:ribosomal protein S14